MIVWGREDRIIDVTGVDTLKCLWPKWRVEVVEEAGHAVFVEKPKLVARFLEEFSAADSAKTFHLPKYWNCDVGKVILYEVDLYISFIFLLQKKKYWPKTILVNDKHCKINLISHISRYCRQSQILKRLPLNIQVSFILEKVSFSTTHKAGFT